MRGLLVSNEASCRSPSPVRCHAAVELIEGAKQGQGDSPIGRMPHRPSEWCRRTGGGLRPGWDGVRNRAQPGLTSSPPALKMTSAAQRSQEVSLRGTGEELPKGGGGGVPPLLRFARRLGRFSPPDLNLGSSGPLRGKMFGKCLVIGQRKALNCRGLHGLAGLATRSNKPLRARLAGA